MERSVDDTRNTTADEGAATAQPDPRGEAETRADDTELTESNLGDVSGGVGTHEGEVRYEIGPDGQPVRVGP